MPFARKIRLVNFYKLCFPSAYNPEIGTEPSVGVSYVYVLIIRLVKWGTACLNTRFPLAALLKLKKKQTNITEVTFKQCSAISILMFHPVLR